MDVVDAIRTRKSVRGYLEKEIEPEKLQAVLDAARMAPSAGNAQEWKFVVVADRRTRQTLMEAARGQAFVGEAPVVIAACAVETSRVMMCGLHSFPIDVAIALDHMALRAVELGLGTCWVGAFDADKVKKALGIPESVAVVELLPLGYPADPAPVQKSRKPLRDIVCYEKWS